MGIHPRLPGLTSDREPAEALPEPVLALPSGESRRSFLAKVAVGGAALTVGSQLVPATRLFPVSGAQEEEVTLDADETQVAFLVSVAKAVAAAYGTAAGTAGLPEPLVELARAFGNHHTQQATALLTVLPEGYEVAPNPGLVAAQDDALGAAADPQAVLAVLRDLEDAVAATHFAAIGSLESQADARLVAIALPVVAQQAAVLSNLLESDLEAILPATQTDEGLLPAADYPLGDPAAEEEGEGGEPGETTTTANDGGEGAEPGEDGGTGQTGEGTETEGGGGTDESGTEG